MQNQGIYFRQLTEIFRAIMLSLGKQSLREPIGSRRRHPSVLAGEGPATEVCMLHYYTFEYGAVSQSDALHVYCSRDRMIGLVVRTSKRDGSWRDGHSRFFVWDEGLGGVEYETERDARASTGVSVRSRDVAAASGGALSEPFG